MDWRNLIKFIVTMAAIIGIPILTIIIDPFQLVGFTFGIIWTGAALTASKWK